MGRFISTQNRNAATSLGAGGVILPGALPTFGTGRFLVISKSRIWRVPDEVHRVRVRLVAGGGGYTTAGQSTSFGTLLSATGGQPGNGQVGGAGGIGIGGDFQASGGRGGHGLRSGGGAAGSELGAGGNGGAGNANSTGAGGGGGGVGGNDGGAGINVVEVAGGGGGSAFGSGENASNVAGVIKYGGPDVTGRYHGFQNSGNLSLKHLFDGFIGGGGYSSSGTSTGTSGGSGAGGAGSYGRSTASAVSKSGRGGFCGGGGGAGQNTSGGGFGGVCSVDTEALPSIGPSAQLIELRVGGGAGSNGDAGSGAGGGGYARGEFDVEPGQTITVTVAQQSDDSLAVSGGLVLVEW